MFKPYKVPPVMQCKIIALWHKFCGIFPYCTHGSALTNMYQNLWCKLSDDDIKHELLPGVSKQDMCTHKI